MSLTPEASYRILGIGPEADLKEVKTAFRKKAFELHPDLNPNDPEAATKFRKLNEAYVFLRNHVKARGKAQAGADVPPPTPEPKASPDFGARTYAGNQKKYKRKTTFTTGPWMHRQEEVLNDILKDPFAKQVFEDIYREIKKGGKTRATTRDLQVNWGKSKVKFDLSGGLFKGVKRLAHKFLDEEQVVSFPFYQLIPGKTIRISIQHGLSKVKKVVEVTIPRDFSIGKPIRLKGLGRRLGPVKGDLFLKIIGK